MRIETLLPLGKLDPGLRAPDAGLDVRTVFDEARRVEALGYDGLFFEETKDDPFPLIALAAQATSRLALGTAVAIAFPRSPTTMAMTAWTLQKLSGGRFVLGLGSQVKGHLERRYGVAFSPLAPWMREYIGAVRAVWDHWQNGAKLDVRGPHYTINLMVPLFHPGPIAHPAIPIHLATVNRLMCQVAGEVADGMRPHPVCTAEYIADVMIPAARAGAAKTGRRLDEFSISIKPLIATGATEAEVAERMEAVRARVAFYASTPAYVAAFEFHGLGALAREMSKLSRAQRWDEMARFITDDILHHYAVVGTFAEIGDKLHARYGEIVTNAEFSIPLAGARDEEVLADLIRGLQACSEAEVGKRLTG
jgi:probable F420-dependent oxidoreductase